MLTAFDWIRRSRSGAELLSILRMLKEDPTCFERLQSLAGFDRFGPVPYALAAPCDRCALYPRLSVSIFCPTCRVIRDGTLRAGKPVRDALVVWGYVNRLPQQVSSGRAFADNEAFASFVRDDRHFLLLLRRLDLQAWLQEMVLYHGPDLKGYLQIMPTWGGTDGVSMGDLLCQAVRQENYFPLDRLRVRFYMRHYQVLRPQEFDREGLLTYEVSEFLRTLEMAVIFRSILRPKEQALLYELLTKADESADSFYWGRLMGILGQRARDLLDAWDVRHWPARRIKHFYELTDYVDYRPAA